MMRWDYINHVARRIGAVHYLEIGVETGECLRRVDVPLKVGVDPEPRIAEPEKACQILCAMTSDDFFRGALDLTQYEGSDLIAFVDGLHHAEQALTDVLNCFDLGAKAVLMHDCNPTSRELQIVPRQDVVWCGDVWRALAYFNCKHCECFRVATFDSDYGVGVLVRLGPMFPVGKREAIAEMNAQDFTYDRLEKARRPLLNLKPPEALETWLELALLAHS